MIQKNKFFLLIFLFTILTTYNFNEQKQNLSIIFPIKKIIIDEVYTFDLTKLKSELNFLRNTSLFFLKEKEIIKIIDKYDFISSIQLKKKYPDSLKIKILENMPVAIEVINRKKFYLTKDGKKLKYRKLKIFENLPIIFGNHKNFNSFFKDLEKNNFKIEDIKALYYFEVGRWDILLKNEKTIKLPKKDYQNILMKIDTVLNDTNFSRYKIFDYRTKGQLILE